MQFKTDENMPEDAADLLRTAGFDAVSVIQQQLGGNDDTTIADVCRQENRILVTFDIDFADIRTYPPADFAGIIVLRLVRQDRPHVLQVMSRVIAALSNEPIAQRLWIVEEDRIRIRE